MCVCVCVCDYLLTPELFTTNTLWKGMTCYLLINGIHRITTILVQGRL